MNAKQNRETINVLLKRVELSMKGISTFSLGYFDNSL